MNRMNHTKTSILHNRTTTAGWAGLSFFLPAAVVCVVLAVNGITPFGNATLITDEGLDWFEHFCRLVEAIVTGDGVFYHLDVGYGQSFYTEFAAGQCSPFLFVALFFSPRRLAAAYSVITVLRAGLCGLFARYMLRRCAETSEALAFALACGYALSGFTACAAWYPSMADGAVFFPLMIEGAHHYVSHQKPVRLFLFAAVFFLTSPRLTIGGIAVTLLFYLAFYLSRKGAILSLSHFALFAATLLCAAGTAAVLVVPLGASAVYYKGGVFSLTRAIDLPGTLCFGGLGTRCAAGSAYVCLAGLLLMGFLAYLLNSWVSRYERWLIGAAAGLSLLAAAVPAAGGLLYGFCAYGSETVNMGFVWSAAACYGTARCLREKDGMSLPKGVIAVGCVTLSAGGSLWLRGAGTFEMLADAGMAAAGAAVFLLTVFDREHQRIRHALAIAGILALFGGIHCGAAAGAIDSPYRADTLYTETVSRMRVNQRIAAHETDAGYAMRFFRRRCADDPAAEGVNLRRSYTAGLDGFAAKLGIMADSAYGGAENYTPLTDIVFGVGYVVQNQIPHSLDHSVQSPAFAVRGWEDETFGTGQNAFEAQNALAAQWFGVDGLCTPVSGERMETADSASNERYGWTFGDDTTTVCRYTVTIPQNGNLYVLCEAGDYEYAVGSDSRSHWKQACAGGIYPLGEQTWGKEVTVYLCARDGREVPAPAFAMLSQTKQAALTERARQRGGTYISRRGSTIRFMLEETGDYMGITSIPYEYGWEVTVDGKKVAPVKVCGGLIGLPLDSGTHSVVMKYVPPLFRESMAVSAVMMVLGLYMTLRTEHEISRRKRVRMAFKAVEKQQQT
ncbi:MAG: YfhO family protein [Clostridia bacterium]|nr:YfhO family protein [Clostridia bacterium]